MTWRTARRRMLSGLAAGWFLSPGLRGLLADEGRSFRIGACDWSLGKRQHVAALALAEQIGLDGVEVSFDGGPEGDLRREEVRQQYRAEGRRRKVPICSLAMGVLTRVPYASDPQAETWVSAAVRYVAAVNDEYEKKQAVAQREKQRHLQDQMEHEKQQHTRSEQRRLVIEWRPVWEALAEEDRQRIETLVRGRWPHVARLPAMFERYCILELIRSHGETVAA